MDFIDAKFYFVVMGFLAYVVVSKIIPNQKVHFRYAIFGGVIFTFGISLAKFLFQGYVFVAMSRYNVIYGSLTAIVLSTLWLYILAIVMLIASEFVAVMQTQKILHKGEG